MPPSIDEEMLPAIEKFRALNKCLKDAEKSGELAIDGEAQELSSKAINIQVDGFGVISLPLIDPQASELIKHCERAPFGRNFQTLVDPNVRDSYQLEPDKFRIANPDWNENLGKILLRVKKGLGCQGEIDAKLYKLLLYKQGGHFLKHRDTEKEKKMFGTLIIQPPSTHTGGELVVYSTNGRCKKVIDFGQKDGKSKFAVHFAAHYADLEH